VDPIREPQVIQQRRDHLVKQDPILIDLALQGGGSHGAFTWGVLDRLLQEPRLRIAAISGTSAGAMNAAVLADGWVEGGADGARTALDKYWQQRVSRAAAFSPLQRSPFRPPNGPVVNLTQKH
jgi:NTE family protein